jgi:hypothetical protein
MTLAGPGGAVGASKGLSAAQLGPVSESPGAFAAHGLAQQPGMAPSPEAGQVGDGVGAPRKLNAQRLQQLPAAQQAQQFYSHQARMHSAARLLRGAVPASPPRRVRCVMHAQRGRRNALDPALRAVAQQLLSI